MAKDHNRRLECMDIHDEETTNKNRMNSTAEIT